MHVVTLLTSPQAKSLDKALVESLLRDPNLEFLRSVQRVLRTRESYREVVAFGHERAYYLLATFSAVVDPEEQLPELCTVIAAGEACPASQPRSGQNRSSWPAGGCSTSMMVRGLRPASV